MDAVYTIGYCGWGADPGVDLFYFNTFRGNLLSRGINDAPSSTFFRTKALGKGSCTQIGEDNRRISLVQNEALMPSRISRHYLLWNILSVYT